MRRPPVPNRAQSRRNAGSPAMNTTAGGLAPLAHGRALARVSGDRYLESWSAAQADARRFVHQAHLDTIATSRAVAASKREGRKRMLTGLQRGAGRPAAAMAAFGESCRRR
jgi:hypothetical protein